jgi:spermidine/putrescine transport system substrate-binding protein
MSDGKILSDKQGSALDAPAGAVDASRTGGVSRRSLLAAAAGAVAWSNLTIINKARAATTLKVLSWPGYDEKPVVGEFEEANKVKVEFKNYIGGEQMLQYFGQVPKGTFDAIISDAEYIQKFVAQGALDPMDPKTFKNLADYHPKYQDFPLLRAPDGKTWGIATRFSCYGISYNKKFVSPEEVDTWQVLFAPKFKGKIVMFDWYLPNMSNASLAIFPNNERPYDISDAQLTQVKDWMMKLRPQISAFAAQNQGLVSALANEDALLTPYGDMDIEMTVAGYDNFVSHIPKEGSIRWSEAACLCKDSANKELAMKWIDYMSGAKVQSNLVYTKGFKARAPNMKVPQFWDAAQTKLMSYVPDPTAPGKMIVETMIEKSYPRGLPIQQPDKSWIDIYNAFKTA